MAEDELGRHLARQAAAHNVGDLNPVEKSELAQGSKITHDSSFLKSTKNAIIKSKETDVVGALGSKIKAVVLYAWEEDSTLQGSPQSTVHVKARIPEIDSMPMPSSLPVDNDPNDGDADWDAIDDFFTFVGTSAAGAEPQPLPKPADIISVDFGNRAQLRDPIYLGLVSSTLLAENPSDLMAPNSKLPAKKSLEKVKKKMRKLAERRSLTLTLSDISKISPAPKEAPPLDINKAPIIGCYVGDALSWEGRYQKGAMKRGLPLPFFWSQDWIKKVVDSGINYLSFKIHGISAARDGNTISDDYTKKISGRTVREEIEHILKVARARKDFEIHGWGYSGVQSFGSGKNVAGLARRPQNEQEAIMMATTEATAVAKKLNFLGISNYHWIAEHHAFQDWPGHIGSPSNPRPGVRTSTAALAMNDLVAKVFANELRKQVPSVRIWFTGFLECISPGVLVEYFDVAEPTLEDADLTSKSWGTPQNPFARVRKKVEGKHYGAPDGRPLIPGVMPVSWRIPEHLRSPDYTPASLHPKYMWGAVRGSLTAFKSQIYGMHIWMLSSQLHQDFNNYPDFKEQIRQLREAYNNSD